MSEIVDFTLPIDAFFLQTAFEAETRIELERIVPTDEEILPFFWVWGTDTSTVLRAARSASAIKDIRVVDSVDDATLFRAVWNADPPGLLDCITEADATVLEATGTAVEWQFRVRFGRHEDVGTFQRCCLERNVPIQVERLHRLAAVESGAQYGLTEKQRETLSMAYERGYFDEPRRTTVEEMADDIGISSRAFSRRLWRGIGRLLANTLGADG